MKEVAWGSVLVTLLLPLLAAVYMFFVVRRASVQKPAEAPSTPGTYGLYYLVGFALTWVASTYLGFYLLQQLGGVETAVTHGEELASQWIALLGVYIGGLWGAILPYRIHARNGHRAAWLWLLIGLAYSVLFYGSTLMME